MRVQSTSQKPREAAGRWRAAVEARGRGPAEEVGQVVVPGAGGVQEGGTARGRRGEAAGGADEVGEEHAPRHQGFKVVMGHWGGPSAASSPAATSSSGTRSPRTAATSEPSRLFTTAILFPPPCPDPCA